MFVPSNNLFLSVLWKFCDQIPLSFKVRFPVDSQSLCQISRLRSLMSGLEPLQQLENFFDMIIFQFVGCTPAGMEFDFIVFVLLLSSCCGFLFVFGCGVSFFGGGSQHPPVNGCSTASCNLCALTGDEYMSFYAAIFNWTLH